VTKVEKGKKIILILNDRVQVRKRLLNLGCRAYHDGLYNLIGANCKYQIIPGGSKNFPYFNIMRFKEGSSSKDIERVFNDFFYKVTKYSPRRVKGGRP